jgi:hypothetical protein
MAKMISDQAPLQARALATKREAAMLVRRAGGGLRPGETIKVRINRAATRLGWSISRTEDIWRLEAKRIDAFEMDQLREAAVSHVRCVSSKHG